MRPRRPSLLLTVLLKIFQTTSPLSPWVSSSLLRYWTNLCRTWSCLKQLWCLKADWGPLWSPYLVPTSVCFVIIIYLHLIPFNPWTSHDKSLYSNHLLQKQSTTWLSKLLSHNNWFVLLCANQVPIDHTVISLIITITLWITLYYFSFVGEKDEPEVGGGS